MPKTHLKGEVPDDVFNAELLKYLKRVEANTDAKRMPSQFEYKNNTYYFERSQGTESGFRVRRSADFVAKEQRRRENLNKPKLSEVERMMVQNYYDEAARRGLHVDHRYPAKHGGMHHPSNLGLMQPKENLRKGDAVGGNYQYEPLIQSEGGSIRFRRSIPTPVQPAPVQPKPAQTKSSKPSSSAKSNLKSSMGTIGFGFSELTGGYTGADSMPRRIDMDPLGTGATIMIP